MADSSSSGASAEYHTYHCLCSELAVAVTSPLQSLPQRQTDGAYICKIDLDHGSTVLVGVAADTDAAILKLDDGFEKRYPIRCSRCRLMIAYYLDKSQFDVSKTGSGPFQGAIYLLPGGLLTTEEMEAGKEMGEKAQMVTGVMA